MKNFYKDTIKAQIKITALIASLEAASCELELVGNSNELDTLWETREALKAMLDRCNEYIKENDLK